jgi:hypothetical protein
MLLGWIPGSLSGSPPCIHVRTSATPPFMILSLHDSSVTLPFSLTSLTPFLIHLLSFLLPDSPLSLFILLALPFHDSRLARPLSSLFVSRHVRPPFITL